MKITVGHINEKIITLKQNEEAVSFQFNKKSFPLGTTFDTIDIVSLPVLGNGEELVFRNGTIEVSVMIDTNNFDIVDKSVKKGLVAEIEIGFARLVDDVLSASATLPTLEDRRVTLKALEAQFKIYNLFQTSVGLGILPNISTGALDSIKLALSYLKMLSLAMDEITLEINSTGIKSPRAKIFENMRIEKGSLSLIDLTDRCSKLAIDVTTITI